MLVVILASSCAVGYYSPQNVNQFGTQTQVVLSEANFRIVQHLEVVIDINNTNLKRADVEKSAYAELIRRANLTGSQALINVVIEEVRREKHFFRLPPYKITQHVAARGTIIEFINKDREVTEMASSQGIAPESKASSQTINTTEKNASGAYQGSAPRSGQTDSQKTQTTPSTNISEADKYYIAWLYKTGAIKQNRVKELKEMFDFAELKALTDKYPADDLKKMAKGYDKKLQKFHN